jgi:hypothetical protein
MTLTATALDTEQIAKLDAMYDHMPEMGKPSGVANPELGTRLAELHTAVEALQTFDTGVATIAKIVPTIGAEAAVAANAIEIACQLQTLAGVDLAEARQVTVIVIPGTADQGDIAAAGTPVGTLNRVQNPATGDNTATFTTSAAGAFSFRVTDTVAETCTVQIIPEGGVPNTFVITFA